ncbi:MAG: group III truncated hemoglobin [Deltaproteobacteria bacterium]|nr:group III truncated hemoglobin [Deltaproteobacteria bacterium]
MRDLESIADCRALVERFYDAARRDPLLGPVFAARLSRVWPDHLETMTRFWGAVLFAQPLYHGSPIERHQGLPIEGAHFRRWLDLWTEAVDGLFSGARAEHAKRGAARMAERMAKSVSGFASNTTTITPARQ